MTEALRKLLPGATATQPVSGRPFLLRVDHDGHDVRLRRWPAGTSPQRVRFVHRLLATVSAAHPGLVGQPYLSRKRTDAVIQIGGRMYDAQTWLPNRPLAGRSFVQMPDGHTVHRPISVDKPMMQALAARVAAFHLASDGLTREPNVPVATIPAVIATIEQGWRDARVRLRPDAPNFPPMQRWLRLSEQVLAEAEKALSHPDLANLPSVAGHVGLWPAHVLVADDTITGLLDPSLAVVTSPLLDVGQLVTRFAGWTGEHAEEVIAGYSAVRPMAPEERRMLPAAAAIDLVLEASNLLKHGYAGEVPHGSREAGAARAGAQDMLDSLESVIPAVLRANNFVSYARKRQLARIQSGKAKGPGPRTPSKRGDKPPKATGPKSRPRD